ncbi:hypothetical protein PPYR_05394 [Photinus pyralis]|uniref:LRRCT domain-containing protein n=1 Tax=Photinus pyralis TaxID=7054 RepID=A0A5N4AUZ9_PHOPY|nr:insulin-like growth factor-binding protein complex acid labile subunit [Photinus pyralis]KAB0801040.1 hypothetical protein PPYR_05394 [Photinus pyralis]
MLLQAKALWNVEDSCPLVCTCQLEHLKETAIHRFVKKHGERDPASEIEFRTTNEVFYEDEFEDSSDNNPVLRAATCILQTETDTIDLINLLPKNIEALTLIQGAQSGNKSLNFTTLQNLPNLQIAELYGSNEPSGRGKENVFNCFIDTALPNLRYLNLDRVSIKVKKELLIKHDYEEGEQMKLENPKSRPFALLQRAKKEILPYNTFLQQAETKNVPSFTNFDNLILLRVSSCEFRNVDWDVFDGLQNLHHLILERNNLSVITGFAFYGLPRLKSLSLARNNLSTIQVTDLAGLLELEYLDLSYNNFQLLSELSFPPFPSLKFANFGNNPINLVLPGTFEVMNTTVSLTLGGKNAKLTIAQNSFSGLKMLQKLILTNLDLIVLTRELLYGMPNLTELVMSGNIDQIEFDAFVDVEKLKKLVISGSHLQQLSMDAFSGLTKLQILDLSYNRLVYLPPGTFDPLKSLKELYLQKNKLMHLPQSIFSQINPKLIRLNENPWTCSCKMSEWKPMVVNRIKQRIGRHCDVSDDKDAGCDFEPVYNIKYTFDTRVTPKCNSPKKFMNWNVFHVLRKQLRCANYKPKYRKKNQKQEITEMETTQSVNEANLYMTKVEKFKKKIKYHPETQEMLSNYVKSDNAQDMPIKISLFSSMTKNDEGNDLTFMDTNFLPPFNLKLHQDEYYKKNKTNQVKGHRKQKKVSKLQSKDVSDVKILN